MYTYTDRYGALALFYGRTFQGWRVVSGGKLDTSFLGGALERWSCTAVRFFFFFFFGFLVTIDYLCASHPW